MKLNPREYAQKTGVQMAMLFVGNLLFALLFMMRFGTGWETNDDYVVASIASGVYGQSSAYTMFNSFVLGLLLRGLYTMLPGLNWFWVLQLVVVLASYAAVGWVMMQRLGKRRGMAFYLFFMLASCRTFYFLWNYTRTATLATSAGALCMIQGLKTGRNRTPIWIGGVLFFFGFCLRFESWLMAFALVLAYLAGEAIVLFAVRRTARHPAEWMLSRRKELVACGIVIVTTLAVFVTEQVVYAQEPWKSYRAYNRARQELYDYKFPDYDANKDFFDSVNITKEDYEIFFRWNHCDFEKMSLEVMQQMVEVCGSTRQRISPWLVVNAVQRFVENPMFLLGVVLSLMCLLCTQKTNWISLAGLYGASIVMLSYLMYVSRFPDRVVSSMGVSFALLTVGCFSREENGAQATQTELKWQQIGAVSLCALLLFNGRFLCNPNNWRVAKPSDKERVEEVNKVWAQFEQDKLYLMNNESNCGYYFKYPIWRAVPRNLEANLYPWGGWQVRLPVTDQMLARFGVENPLGDVAKVDDMLLMSNTIDSIEQNAAYVRRNYTPDASWSVYDLIEGNIVASFMRPMQPGPVCEAVPYLQEITQQEGYQSVQLTLDGVTYDADTVYCLVLQGEGGEQVTLRTKAQPTETGVSLWVGIPYSEWAEDAPLTGYVAARAENTTETLWQTKTVTLTA